jgi:hypothetical protein
MSAMKSRYGIGSALAVTLAIALGGVGAVPWAAAQTQDQAAVKAGVSAAVRGDVRLAALRQPVARRVASGEGIFLGDHVTSAAESGMQILLLDQTVFTLGPQADMVIDNFVYDPSSGSGKLAATITKGAFRFVTGRVAANNPSDMEVQTPAATIGIRGTIVAGRVDGESALVVLLGPGQDTDTSERIGRVTVTNKAGSTELDRAGYATLVKGPNEPPGKPFAVSLDQLLRLDLQAGVSRASGTGTGVRAGQATNQSGESTAITAETVNTLTAITTVNSTVTNTVITTVTPPVRCTPHGGISC